jgi:hypothetical protein
MATLYYRPSNLMKGPAVGRLQQLGEAVIGEDLVLNDSVFGKETEHLVKEVQKFLGLTPDGYAGPATWNAIFAHFGRLPSGGIPTPMDGVQVIDCRATSRGPKKHFYGVVRPWDKITGVMLHQTGCGMPASESGWLPVNAHIGVTREGVIILMHPFDWEIWHGHRPSKWTIGIEIEGNFCGVPGLKGSCWTPGGGPHTLTKEQKNAFPVLLKIIKEEFDKNDGKWEHVLAHRQSSDQREADPGKEIWEVVGRPWMAALSANDGGDHYCTGSGKPIPREWDPRKPTRYWG